MVSIGAETDIDADFVKKNVEDFTTKDDVFREEFLEGIIIHGLNDSSVTIKVEKSELHEWNTEWIKGQFPGDQEGILRPGPYLIMSGVPYEVFRIMDDENKAFIQSTLTSKDSKTTFYPADDISDDDCAPGILVPSRLCADPSICYPLDGIRVAVKDVFHLDGMSTSLNSRPYRQAHSVQNYTASAISNLVSKGAHIVGKTRMSAFILQEHPTQNVNSVSPLNPRADGHQIPGGSSSGSAASVAAYDWLDVALGTDGEKPAWLTGTVADTCSSNRQHADPGTGQRHLRLPNDNWHIACRRHRAALGPLRRSWSVCQRLDHASPLREGLDHRPASRETTSPGHLLRRLCACCWRSAVEDD